MQLPLKWKPMQGVESLRLWTPGIWRWPLYPCGEGMSVHAFLEADLTRSDLISSAGSSAEDTEDNGCKMNGK